MTEFFLANELEPTPTGLESRYLELLSELQIQLGETHPGLKNTEKFKAENWQPAYLLTYGDIVKRNSLYGLESPNLPIGYNKIDDLEIEIVLYEHHLHYIDTLLSDPTFSFEPRKLGGLMVFPLTREYIEKCIKNYEQVLPVIEGYRWAAGYEMKLNQEDSVMLFVPLEHPTRVGGMPFPLIYSKGNPDRDKVLDIVSDYGI